MIPSDILEPVKSGTVRDQLWTYSPEPFRLNLAHIVVSIRGASRFLIGNTAGMPLVDAKEIKTCVSHYAQPGNGAPVGRVTRMAGTAVVQFLPDFGDLDLRPEGAFTVSPLTSVL